MDVWGAVANSLRQIFSVVFSVIFRPQLCLDYQQNGRFYERVSRYESNAPIPGARIRLWLYNASKFFPAPRCAVYIECVEREGTVLTDERLQLEWAESAGFEKRTLPTGKRAGCFVDVCFADNRMSALQIQCSTQAMRRMKFEAQGEYRLRILACSDSPLMASPDALTLKIDYQRNRSPMLLVTAIKDQKPWYKQWWY